MSDPGDALAAAAAVGLPLLEDLGAGTIVPAAAKMTATTIAWCDFTWNYMTGCDPVSSGCAACYAEAIARRFAGSKAWPNGFQVTLHPERLNWPFKWPAGSRVFVVSMGDPYHKKVPDWLNQQAFAVMALCGHLTFQLLTKRPGVMASKLSSPRFWAGVDAAVRAHGHDPSRLPTLVQAPEGRWLSNLWLGTSVEDQLTTSRRLRHLRRIHGAVRWLSMEPLLAAVDLVRYFPADPPNGLAGAWLDWVVVGGESGQRARPFDPAWAESLVTQCRQLGVAPFVKQLGSRWAREHHAVNSKGEDPAEWPDRLRVREYPTVRAA
jgi:protein gp37